MPSLEERVGRKGGLKGKPHRCAIGASTAVAVIFFKMPRVGCHSFWVRRCFRRIKNSGLFLFERGLQNSIEPVAPRKLSSDC